MSRSFRSGLHSDGPAPSGAGYTLSGSADPNVRAGSALTPALIPCRAGCVSSDFLSVLLAVIPVFLVLASGGLLRRVGALAQEADHSLMRLTVYLLVPSLILDSILENPVVRRWENLAWAPALGFVLVTGGMLAGLLLARAVRLPMRVARTFGYAAGLQNYGYIALPLALLLFDRATLGVVFLFNLGVETAMWSMAPLFLGRGSMQECLKKILNPPLLTIAAALALNLSGIDVWIPAPLREMFRMLGQCAVPMGLILAGAGMADVAHEFRRAEGGRVMVLGLIVRSGLLPLVFLAAACRLPLSIELRQVLVLQGAMPAAVFSLVLARLYDGHPGTALRVIAVTSLAGLATIPLWIRIGLAWIADRY